MAHKSSPPPSDLEDLEALVLKVFERVWKEFNAADTEYCEAAIGSLVATLVTEDNTLSTEFEGAAELPYDTRHSTPHASSVDTSSAGPSKPHVPRVRAETDTPTLTLPSTAEPCPEYESCAPTNRSIFRGDDSDDLQFLPFADEPAFDKKTYQKFFKTLAWQGGEQMDADCESLLG